MLFFCSYYDHLSSCETLMFGWFQSLNSTHDSANEQQAGLTCDVKEYAEYRGIDTELMMFMGVCTLPKTRLDHPGCVYHRNVGYCASVTSFKTSGTGITKYRKREYTVAWKCKTQPQIPKHDSIVCLLLLHFSLMAVYSAGGGVLLPPAGCRNRKVNTNMDSESESVLEIIQQYFDAGHKYDVIVDMLSTIHGISMRIRTLKTHLKKAGLFRLQLNYNEEEEEDRRCCHVL
ncbi:cell wall integrity and stress response component 2-like%2C partial [Xyrichtys novacula]|uniref:Cell wall integrity and stress response component 2-like, partial n=1 Tax=Xyrichtys novacula TaxID=13765 RepID=A0AAV1H6R4_XYRNO|nr:cell wall integrity and stress response component 2-like%2C partial [Xyrichtys novacula]